MSPVSIGYTLSVVAVWRQAVCDIRAGVVQAGAQAGRKQLLLGLLLWF